MKQEHRNTRNLLLTCAPKQKRKVIFIFNYSSNFHIWTKRNSHFTYMLRLNEYLRMESKTIILCVQKDHSSNWHLHCENITNWYTILQSAVRCLSKWQNSTYWPLKVQNTHFSLSYSIRNTQYLAGQSCVLQNRSSIRTSFESLKHSLVNYSI